ncbi:hypothetical protein RI367_007817 [Sorochytrium milnesiophthora]
MSQVYEGRTSCVLTSYGSAPLFNDTTWGATSATALRETMQLIHDYNACTGIVANPTKSRIMIAGARGDGHPFKSGTGDVPVLGPND